jgi:hypothetical protein
MLGLGWEGGWAGVTGGWVGLGWGNKVGWVKVESRVGWDGVR